MLVSAGNFHGQPLAFALDALAMAVSELASISERRVERLVNPNLSDGLPAFLTTDGGLNSGFMIPQYVAASLVSENKSLCHPASVDSIPTSAGQEDHVSMGNAAGLKAWQVVANSERALAIELLAGAQAVEFLAPLEPGRGARATHDVRPVALAAAPRRPVARPRHRGGRRRDPRRVAARRRRVGGRGARMSRPPATGRCPEPPPHQASVPRHADRLRRARARDRRSRLADRAAMSASAAVIAAFFFVVASAWSVYRWRRRLRAEAADAPCEGGRALTRGHVARRARRERCAATSPRSAPRAATS